jgi:hypothetical protein
LASHPEGRASVADLNRYMAILTCSGTDWSQRMRQLAARAPELNIFSSGFVQRDPSGWQITLKGRYFLMAIEAPLAEPALPPAALPTPVVTDAAEFSSNVIQLADHKVERGRWSRAAEAHKTDRLAIEA